MVKLSLYTLLVCALITSAWMSYLDTGPFVYAHGAPDKLNKVVSEQYLAPLTSRGISSIRYGSKKPRRGELLSVSVSGEDSYSWKGRIPPSGPVKLHVSDDDISVYWDIPENMTFGQASYEIRSVLGDVLNEYDRLTRVKNTFK